MIRAVEPRPGTTAGIASAVRAVPPQKTPVDPAQIRAPSGEPTSAKPARPRTSGSSTH